MRALRRLFVLVAALLVLGAAAFTVPARAQDPLVPPTLLGPENSAAVTAGSGVTFRVGSDVAGDGSYLWIRVSGSPAITQACGTIGGDVASVGLDATAEPGVYAGTPTVYQLYDHWLNRAGTYYWQAYRIHYGGGADGCIETDVRTLQITGVRPIEIGPQPLEPADGERRAAGGVAFRVQALAGDDEHYLWLNVSRSPQVVGNGLIGDEVELEEFARSGDPSIWSALPTYYAHASFWMNTAGTYYWQPYRISSFGDPDGYVEGPVRTFTLTAAPAPAPTVTPTPATPVTIRGDEAFANGTANDLYLACTTLDLYLVDVLPAGSKVAVTGAADLRLRGRTVTLQLDGRNVGTAVVGDSGAFSATVRRPAPGRLATARYRAVIGTTRSQNLKLTRRMVAAKLWRSGTRLLLTGRITRPFARRPARIGIQRYVACGRKETLGVRTVRPSPRTGRFSVSFPVPAASARALMYRATTKVARRAGGAATIRTYTLPRALDVAG